MLMVIWYRIRLCIGVLQVLSSISLLQDRIFLMQSADLVAYSDADWAGCPTTRRSTSGYCVFLGKNLLSWSAKRQTTLSRSSAEAEYRGVANAVAETCWLRNFLRELHTPLSSATLVYCDNVSAVYLSSNPVQHQRTKHIEIDIHFIRDLVAPALFEEFRTSLSVRCPPAPTAGECSGSKFSDTRHLEKAHDPADIMWVELGRHHKSDMPARRHDSEKPATSYKDLEVADASDSESISIIEFVSRLKEKGQTYMDPCSGQNLHELTELLDQKLDSEFICVAKYGYCDVMIAITETGWPLDGDLTQHGANRENAAV
ncbi:ribonuclease H-like domain-containing protein [Tanacetum coccineum]|uniref:Ribonuclease H-like domain-containing protein n=1 Tax=Tanacetum coccineum TaxID=301880 RepID=A0ABQ5C2K2_9ASTR